jgi:putative MATE family efflux protein
VIKLNNTQSNKKIEMMANAKIPALVLKFAVPTILAMLVNAIYNAVDAMFVSWLGVEQAGAISVAFPVFMVILGIGLTFGTGAGSYISRLLGEEDYNKASITASTAIFITIFVTVVFIILAMIFLEPILKLAGASEGILPYAVDYCKIIIVGSLFPILSRTMNNIIRAEGNVKFNSIAVLLGALLNILLDPIFIFTFDMGIRGAAYATILSQAITTLLLYFYFARGKSAVEIKISNFKPSVQIMSEVLKIGVPTFMFQLLMSISLGMINKSAGSYAGDAAVAAMGIANRIFVISMYVVFGFAKAFQPIAGFNYGAGNYKRLTETIWFSIKCTTVFAVLVSLLTIIFAQPIFRAFTHDAQVVTIGVKALFALNLTFPLFGIQMIFSSLFLAMGKAKQGSFLSLARQGIFFFPMMIILPRFYGLTGVIYAQSAADLLTSICAIFMGIALMKEINEKAYIPC